MARSVCDSTSVASEQLGLLQMTILWAMDAFTHPPPPPPTHTHRPTPPHPHHSPPPTPTLDKMAAVFADIFKCISMNEKFCIYIRISLKFVSKGSLNNMWALIQVMAWHWISNKPMLTRFIDAYMRHPYSRRWVKEAQILTQFHQSVYLRVR